MFLDIAPDPVFQCFFHDLQGNLICLSIPYYRMVLFLPDPKNRCRRNFGFRAPGCFFDSLEPQVPTFGLLVVIVESNQAVVYLARRLLL
jgi:hypothetical protein